MTKKPGTGPRIVASIKPLPPTPYWTEVLDEELEKQFPTITARTVMTAKGYKVMVELREGGAVTPKLYRAINQFVAGFVACERSFR